MSLIHKYVARECFRNLYICSIAFCILFLTFDFFDRIDNVVKAEAHFWTIIQYFLLKVPHLLNLTLPISMLVAGMFTVANLAKNSELTAMRAAGLKVSWISRPIFTIALLTSFFSIFLGETIVPYAQRRVREIYNIDIQERDKTGEYSQTNFWWRSEDTFYSVSLFDSRENTFYDFSKLIVDKDFNLSSRIEAKTASWVNQNLGWSMNDVRQYKITSDNKAKLNIYNNLALPLKETPRDFYDAETDPGTMSYSQLSKFIAKQNSNGVATTSYRADLFSKISFPFVNLICTIVALPFALRTARSRKMGPSFIAGLLIGFSYYVVHSFSMALGRAELFPPLMAAWTANLIMGMTGIILMLGAEAPE